MFRFLRSKRYQNNPLHEAILSGRSEEIRALSRKEFLSQKNRLGLTPIELSKFFNSYHLFSPVLSLPKIEKNGELFRYSQEEFEKYIGVTYLHHLEFQSIHALAWVRNECKKGLKKNLITTEQKWLGSYYEEEIAQQREPPVFLRWINAEIGWGVFADKEITPKTFIGEYTGFFRKKKIRLDKKNSYCFEYMIGETQETPFTIDAQDKGNFTRFINHSSLGNVDPMIIYSGGIMRVILYANQKIPKGAQITYDYGPDYWAKRESPDPVK